MNKNQNKKQEFELNFNKVYPQINGFDGDIYDPNLIIDVFDSYFYQVMITRYYYYFCNCKVISENENEDEFTVLVINKCYDMSNRGSKFQEFFSMIKMPNKNDSRYKEALIRVFTLTLFELNYNINDFYGYNKLYKQTNEAIFNSSFLKYYLEDSIYKTDFKNLITNDDLNDIKFPYNYIEYLYPNDIFQKYHSLTKDQKIKKNNRSCTTYNKNNIIERRILNKSTIQNMYAIYQGESEPNYDDSRLVIDRIENPFLIKNIDKNLKENYYSNVLYLIDFYDAFFGCFWNCLRKNTNIYKINFNNTLYIPRAVLISNPRNDYFENVILNNYCITNIKINIDEYFDNIDYYFTKFKYDFISQLINNNYIGTLIGFVLYKDDIEITKSIINPYISTCKKNDLIRYINLVFRLLTYNKLNTKFNIENFTNNQNFNQNFDFVLEKIKDNINLISNKNCNKLLRDILKELYKSSIQIELSKNQSILIKDICNLLSNKALSAL